MTGEVDREVLKHYHEMIDALLEANIEPMVTFHHFTHPIWFNDMGSWEKTDNIEFFVKFCEVCHCNQLDSLTILCR